jgi:HSP20 family protein
VHDDKFEERWGSFRDLVAHMLGENRHCETEVMWYPATDAYVSGDEFVVRMDVSGVARDDLAVVLEKNLLHVRGIRREPRDERRRFHKMEIAVGPFGRTIEVPADAARGEVTARYRDGILEIRLAAGRRRRGATHRIEVES